MEGKGLKSVIMCVLVVGLVVEQIQAVSNFCCPNFKASNCYYRCIRSGPVNPDVCVSPCGFHFVHGTTCPSGYQKFNLFPNSEEAIASDYCKLGCTSSVCDTIKTDVGSDAVEHCNNACSRFCTKGVEIAMVNA